MHSFYRLPVPGIRCRSKELDTESDRKEKDDKWLFLSALLFGKIDACLLLVEDKCVAVVAGPAGREGLQVLAQQVSGSEIRAAYVPHHPVQIFFSLLNMIMVSAKAGLRIRMVDGMWANGRILA
jgi:hypothetical protein